MNKETERPAVLIIEHNERVKSHTKSAKASAFISGVALLLSVASLLFSLMEAG